MVEKDGGVCLFVSHIAHPKKTVVVERRRILLFKHIAKFYLLDFNSAQEIVDKILSLFDFESIPSMKKGHRRSAKPRKNGSK